MLEIFKESLCNQFDAALCTLDACIDRCPENAWNGPVGGLAFCQVAFHTLFFADLYLGTDEASLRTQPFHRDHATSFRDYEELDDRAQRLLYDRLFLKAYLLHCRKKASLSIQSETVQTLAGPSGFQRPVLSRAELHVYNIRHVQHHSAQLSLRLRIELGEQVPWIGSGWRDLNAVHCS